MSFTDFLIEHYMWILAVLISLILIVIGILVDAKNKQKKSSREEPVVQNTNVSTLNEGVAVASDVDSQVVSTPMSSANSLGGTSVEPAMTATPVAPVNPIGGTSVEPVMTATPVAPVNPIGGTSVEPAMTATPVAPVNPNGGTSVEPAMVSTPVPSVNPTEGNVSSGVSASNVSGVVTTNGSQPFDINSMFANNQ